MFYFDRTVGNYMACPLIMLPQLERAIRSARPCNTFLASCSLGVLVHELGELLAEGEITKRQHRDAVQLVAENERSFERQTLRVAVDMALEGLVPS